MNLLRAVRPFLAARLRHAAPLREKDIFLNKAGREIVMSPPTAFACYTFCTILGVLLIYGGYRFVILANARDIERAKYLERIDFPDLKPRP